jgi:subtilisin family serine protease
LKARRDAYPFFFVFIFNLFPLFCLSEALYADQQYDESATIIQVTPDSRIIFPDGLPEEEGRKYSKLDSSLWFLSKKAKVSLNKAIDQSKHSSLKIKNNTVLAAVIFKKGYGEETARAVARSGGEVLVQPGPEKTSMKCWIPINNLDSLASLEFVRRIKRPRPSIIPYTPPPSQEISAASPVVSEALVPMNVPAWHTAGHTGKHFAKRIKVGIIDFGFEGYTSLQAAGELPSDIVIKNFVEGEGPSQVNGTTKHGAACAEIIHDIVPDAKLYFAKTESVEGGSGDILKNIVTWFISQGVEVISESIGYYNESLGDGTGPIAEQITRARDNGILWVTSAGNERQRHWGGQFNPFDIVWSGYDITVHKISGIRYIYCWGIPDYPECDQIPAGEQLYVAVRWEDTWERPTTDYDLYIVKWVQTGEDKWDWLIIEESIKAQTGQDDQHPYEEVIFTTSGDTTIYGFFVRKYSDDPAVNMEMFSPGTHRRLVYWNDKRSLCNGADADDVISVAAVHVEPYYDQENYSSEGPTNGPGGSATGGKVKPDIAGYANVSTKTYGSKDFPGTSAATPHAAGAVALVMGAFPSWSLSRVEDYLMNNAKDLGAVGKDNEYGYGRLYLGTPPAPEVYIGYIYLLLTTPATP